MDSNWIPSNLYCCTLVACYHCANTATLNMRKNTTIYNKRPFSVKLDFDK